VLTGNLKETFLSLKFHRKTTGEKESTWTSWKNSYAQGTRHTIRPPLESRENHRNRKNLGFNMAYMCNPMGIENLGKKKRCPLTSYRKNVGM
jgi:hypothetical protein